jgi:hypothetical protein
MAYYTKVLQPDETVKVVGRLHWFIYLRGLLVLVFALAVAVGSRWLADPVMAQYTLWAAAAVGALGLLLLLAA